MFYKITENTTIAVILFSENLPFNNFKYDFL